MGWMGGVGPLLLSSAILITGKASANPFRAESLLRLLLLPFRGRDISSIGMVFARKGG